MTNLHMKSLKVKIINGIGMCKLDTIRMVVEVAFQKLDYSQNLCHLFQGQTLKINYVTHINYCCI